MATPAYNPDGSIPTNFDPNMGMGGANPNKNPIEQIYQSELGRASDEGGLSNWTNLYNTGMSLDDIRQQIGGSDEGQRFDINTMYREDLGRDADTGGLNFWLSALQGGMSLDDIRNQGIRGSEEFINRQATPTHPRYPEGYDPVTGTIVGQQPTERPGDGYGYGTPLQPQVANPYTTPQPTFDPYAEPRGFGPLNDNPSSFDPRSLYIGQPTPQIADPYAVLPRPKNVPIDSRQLFDATTGEYYYSGDPRFSQPTSPYDTFFTQNKDGSESYFNQGQQRAVGGNPIGDPIIQFVKNIGQAPQQIQIAFNDALAIYGDPVQAARFVMTSLR